LASAEPALAVTEPVSLPLQSTEACTVTDGLKIGMHPSSLSSCPSGHDVAADGSTVAEELLGAKAKKPPTTMSAVASTLVIATPRGRLVDCLMRYPFEGLWFAYYGKRLVCSVEQPTHKYYVHTAQQIQTSMIYH